jgi:hypothetical protein
MVEDIEKSAYLADGQNVYADQAQNMAIPAEACERLVTKLV